MQVTEKQSDGLKRELKITIPAKDLEAKLKEQLEEMKDKVQLKGFRPGKVPYDYLRRLYGKQAMGEIIQKEVSSTNDAVLKERDERAAFQPMIKMTEDDKEIEQILTCEMDLSYLMTYEILPVFDLADFSKMKVEKLVADIDPKEIDAGIEDILENSVGYEAVTRKAKDKDRLTLDFVGKLDGETFEGGSAEDAFLVLGSQGFIPGFEEGLIGAMAGDEITVEGIFPEDYNAEHLAGKSAQFEVSVKEVGEPSMPKADDEFAKTIGFDTIEALRTAVEGGIKGEQDGYGRDKMKKTIMDELDNAHEFELPPSLVENEFDGIWEQVTSKMGDDGKNFGEDGEDKEDDARKKYQDIAERRVRLGLILSQIAEKNEITISEKEVTAALSERIKQFPGQEQQVIEFYQQNPSAVAEIRAPLLEEKVIDYLLELMQIDEKKVSREELVAVAEDDED
ncbi:MAG: trigger factor [bacterium]|nr:trigger factor [bacterium]